MWPFFENHYRFFVLNNEAGLLEYFVNEQSRNQKPRGTLQLAGAVISPSDEDSHTFTVNAASGEQYKLRGMNEIWDEYYDFLFLLRSWCIFLLTFGFYRNCCHWWCTHTILNLGISLRIYEICFNKYVLQVGQWTNLFKIDPSKIFVEMKP